MYTRIAPFLLCSLLLAIPGCAGMGQSGRQGPLPSSLKHAYEQCKDGGGRECFERILGPADGEWETKSGVYYMRWIASSRTRTADNIYQRNESASGPCKLEINLDDNKMVKWLFTGICRDEILNDNAAWVREMPQGPPLCRRLNFRQPKA